MKHFSATHMANKLGTSASEVNLWLERKGYQTQVEVLSEGKTKRYKWVPTPEGEPYARIVKGNRGTIQYEMLCWVPTILDELGYVAPPNRSEFDALTEEVRQLRAKLEALYVLTGHGNGASR